MATQEIWFPHMTFSPLADEAILEADAFGDPADVAMDFTIDVTDYSFRSGLLTSGYIIPEIQAGTAEVMIPPAPIITGRGGLIY